MGAVLRNLSRHHLPKGTRVDGRPSGQESQLIIHSSLNCHKGGWLVYDRHFRLKAAATGLKDWSTIETNIWRMVFLDRPSFSTSRQATPSTPRQTTYFSSNQSPAMGRRICLDWNDSPSPNCPYPIASMNINAIDVCSTPECLTQGTRPFFVQTKRNTLNPCLPPRTFKCADYAAHLVL